MDFISVYKGVRQQHASEHDPVYCVIYNTLETSYIMLSCLYMCITSVKKQINGLSFDSVFLCGTFGMSIMAKYTWLNKIQLTALVNCSGNPKMISYMSTKSFFFLLNVEFKQTTQHILKNNGHHLSNHNKKWRCICRFINKTWKYKRIET